MSFSLGSLFHPEALKLIAVEVLRAAKPLIDSAIDAGKVVADSAVASQPLAAAAAPVVDSLIAQGKNFTDAEIDLVVARLLHLAANQEAKVAAVVAP